MGFLHIYRHLGEAGRVEEAAARADMGLVDVRRHDEAEQGVLVVDGLLEGGRLHQAGDVVD